MTQQGREELCDTDRIGIWGSSFSGGHVVYVAARGPRVKAFVRQVGSMDARRAIQNSQLRRCVFQQGTARTRGKIGYSEAFAEFNNLRGQPVWEMASIARNAKKRNNWQSTGSVSI